MPTLAATLRHEIRRLAKAEVVRALRPLARMKRQVKSLRLGSRGSRRTLVSLERGLRRLSDRLSAQSLRARVRKPSAGPRVAPRVIRALRDGLHMTRLEFAKLLGVSPGSIFGWETGRTIPRGGSRARLVALRRKKGGAARGRGRKARRGRRGRQTATRSRTGRRSRRG
jgi:DNA-binding transcriptional regulator YiaG